MSSLAVPEAGPQVRSRRWGRRIMLGLALTLAAVGVMLWGLFRSLDEPVVKRRLQALVRLHTGFDLDYGGTRLRLLSGLRVEAVVVRTPAGDGAAARELVRVGTLEAGWSVRSLLSPGAKLSSLALRDVELTLVQGPEPVPPAGGAPPTSAPTPPPMPPPTPLSRLLGELLGRTPPVARVSVERAAVTLVQLDSEKPGERWRLTGAALAAELARADGGWRLHAQAGARSAPLVLSLTHEQGDVAAGAAELQLWLEATATPTAAAVTLDLQVSRQTLVPQLQVRRLVHLEARFLPGPGKSQVTLAGTELADGIGLLDATAELPDAPAEPPLLRTAHGTLDLRRLLRLGPAGPVPASVQEAWLRFDIDQLVLAAVPRLLLGGRIAAQGSADGLALELPALGLWADRGQLTLKAEPTADGAMAVQLAVPLRAVRLVTRTQRLSGTAVELSAAGRLDRAGAWTGTAGLRFQSLERSGVGRLAAQQGSMTVRADGLLIDPAAPLFARGQIEVKGELGSLTLARPRARLEAQGLSFTARGQLLGRAPYAVELTLPIDRLRLLGGRGRPLLAGRARLHLQLTELFPDFAHPRRTRAAAKVAVELGETRAQLSLKKGADSVAFEGTATAPSLAAVPALLGESLAVPWDKVGLMLSSKGRLDRLGSGAPSLDHRTEVQLTRPRLTHSGVTMAAQGLTLLVSSRGTARQHQGEADLRVQGLAIGGRVSGDGHLKLALTADVSVPTLRLQLGAEAAAGPEVSLTATLGFDRARRAVSYDFDAHFARLAPLRPLLAGERALHGFDLGGLKLGLGGRGTAVGLVDKVSASGIPSFTSRPLALLGIDGSLELRAAGLRWADGNRAVQAPALTLLLGLRTDGDRRMVRGDLSFAELHVALAHHQLDFAGVHDLLELTVRGDLAQGEGELSHELSLGTLRQNFAPGYAVGDVKFVLQARRSREGVVRISSLQLINPASGTVLKLRGGLELGDERRSLSLRGTLEQNLARLWNVPGEYTGQGTSSLSLRLESGNLSLFHALAALRVTDGTVRLPGRGLAVESFDGEVPISVDLLLDRRGVRLLRDAARNAYAELRFSDQHPLLSRRSFISVARLKTPLLTVGPLAGNLQIENNIVALSQLEMGLLEGRLTGQCLLDWGEKDAAIQLHLRASNLKGSTGERFDGNTAVVISARERSIDGRAEILHIGRRHLLALLELHDPHHADAAVNRVRSALSLGYPDRVRLSFDHGFAAARITLGGLASVVRINELRGIPIGPILDRVLTRPPEPENKGP